MNKILRYSLVVLLMMLFNGVSASNKVVILPSDFTPTEAADYATYKDGVMVSVTASTVTDTQMRIFKSQSISIASMSGIITKVEISCMAEGTEKYGPGCFGAVDGYTYEGTTGTWTGNSSYLVLTAESAQVRATLIVVTLEGGGEVDDPDDDDGPLSKFEYKSGTITESADGNHVIVDYVAENADAEITGKIIFDFENSLCTLSTMSANFPTVEMAQEYYQWSLDNKEKEGIETVTIDGVTVTVTMKDEFYGLSKIVIKSMMKMMIDDEESGYGAKESPCTPNMANIYAGTLEPGKTTKEDVYVKGKIASIKYPFSADKGTATFFISADGNNDFTFQCYSVYYLENKPWVDGNTQIKVGDDVIICGKLTNYNGITPETASKQAYIYSLNGVTKNESGDTPGPQVEEISVAKALEIINALGDGAKTDNEYMVKGYVTSVTEISTKFGNATFTIADEKGGTSILTVYRAKDANGENITDENLLKVDDLVVVQGKLQKYVKNGVVTPELATGGKILTVNGKSTDINNIERNKSYNGAIYNLAGQKVGKDYKGFVIMNGKKIIQK